MEGLDNKIFVGWYSTFTRSFIYVILKCLPGFQGSALVKNPTANAGDLRDESSTPGSGIFPGGGHGNPLQYSYLEKPMGRGPLLTK